MLKEIPPVVTEKFEQEALNLIQSGRKRYSARTILERMRWHAQIDKEDRSFKVSDHWSAPLARWFIEKYPEHTGFFVIKSKQID